MTTVSNTKFLMESGAQKVFVAGVVKHRPSLPATMSVTQHKFRAPSKVPTVSGMKSPATKVPFGHVRISTFPKHFAGEDAMGFMC